MAESGPTPEQRENPDERIYVDVSVTDADDVGHALVRDKHEVELDEPWWVPVGNDTAPCPADYLLVATAGCQVEVLRQCLEKARIEDYEIRLHAERQRANPDNAPDPFPEHTSMRIPAIDFELTVETTPEFEGRVQRCLDVCEDACIVSRSVEDGIDFSLSKSLTLGE
jgi:uncharacterized OsmC-like protein